MSRCSSQASHCLVRSSPWILGFRQSSAYTAGRWQPLAEQRTSASSEEVIGGILALRTWATAWGVGRPRGEPPDARAKLHQRSERHERDNDHPKITRTAAIPFRWVTFSTRRRPAIQDPKYAGQSGTRQTLRRSHGSCAFLPARIEGDRREPARGGGERMVDTAVGGASASTPARDAGLLERALFEVKRVIVGQDRMVERMLVCLLAKGHCLLEGVPGVAKTLAVETLATVAGGTFARLQFTPDLVPVRHRRHPDLQAGLGAVRHRARPGVRQLRAHRRDQPGARQGAVGAARGHGRRARSRSAARTYPMPQPFLVHGHAEPDRVRGRLPAARRRSATASS